MRFHIHVINIHLEGTVSQILYIGPSFYFMKSRKNNKEKIIKIFPFFEIKTKLRPVLKF